MSNTDPDISDRERERRAQQRAASLAQNQSYTIKEWCAKRRISKAMFYKLDGKGKGPRTHYAGTKRLISPQADADWIAEREAEAAEATAAD
jgi:hypothetical protein